METSQLEEIANRSQVNEERSGKEAKKQYCLFCEQYLEKPVIKEDYGLALSPTVCTIKGVPTVDDF